VVVAVLFLYGILYFFSIILAVVAWLYVGVSLVLSLIRLLAGKKSKTLEEFEPEPEDEETN
jgi:CDP-diacylglycerol--serine O-phosphatidyltransferase